MHESRKAPPPSPPALGQRSGRHKAEQGAVMSVNDPSLPPVCGPSEGGGSRGLSYSVYATVAKDLTWSCWGQTPAPLTALPADPLTGHPARLSSRWLPPSRTRLPDNLVTFAHCSCPDHVPRKMHIA